MTGNADSIAHPIITDTKPTAEGKNRDVRRKPAHAGGATQAICSLQVSITLAINHSSVHVGKRVGPHSSIDQEITKSVLLKVRRRHLRTTTYKPISVQEQKASPQVCDCGGTIRQGSSPAATLVVLVRKLGGGIRICVDYRELNNIAIKNRYPIPLIGETLDRLGSWHAQKFSVSRFDIVAAPNQIRIKKGPKWLTVFNTRLDIW
jgi:hypothetical protein